ncbi:Reticulocalbin-2 [Armadillidium vulgare]|nr:Reticulocalbin-2 [Armadillidium vulgare]
MFKKNLVNILSMVFTFFKVIMKSKSRIALWCFLAFIYVLFIVITHFFNIPLKSRSVSSRLQMFGPKDILENSDYHKKGIMKMTKLSIEREYVNEESESILRKIFKNADKNSDSYLDTIELVSWIGIRIKEHLTQALQDNIFIFTAIDIKPRNEAIMREKAAWSQSVRDDPSRLSLDEFLAFRHPESSHATIIAIVEETLGRLDVDEDGVLSETEFSDPEFNEIPDHLNNNQFREERIKEFRTAVDKDGDGNANRRELIDYFNPRNIHHAEKDALDLIGLADVNGDGKLSLAEVLMHKEEFMRSKMVDVSISFHDEF